MTAKERVDQLKIHCPLTDYEAEQILRVIPASDQRAYQMGFNYGFADALAKHGWTMGHVPQMEV